MAPVSTRGWVSTNVKGKTSTCEVPLVWMHDCEPKQGQNAHIVRSITPCTSWEKQKATQERLGLPLTTCM